MSREGFKPEMELVKCAQEFGVRRGIAIGEVNATIFCRSGSSAAHRRAATKCCKDGMKSVVRGDAASRLHVRGCLRIIALTFVR
ncbi:unnamed protein product [Toxocara canis]|uniref:Transposase n=1 Tax=Toxocara canis TaxID=6265 RepID=A0A183V590_TOXCA|nr:unnamed protein product [Toxocara canis]